MFKAAQNRMKEYQDALDLKDKQIEQLIENSPEHIPPPQPQATDKLADSFAMPNKKAKAIIMEKDQMISKLQEKICEFGKEISELEGKIAALES